MLLILMSSGASPGGPPSRGDNCGVSRGPADDGPSEGGKSGDIGSKRGRDRGADGDGKRRRRSRSRSRSRDRYVETKVRRWAEM